MGGWAVWVRLSMRGIKESVHDMRSRSTNAMIELISMDIDIVKRFRHISSLLNRQVRLCHETNHEEI
jgi:hypothetical protein